MSHLWGIDLGGTKIEGVVMPETPLLVPVPRDEEGSGVEIPNPLARIRIDTEAEQGYGHIIRRIEYLIEGLRAETGQNPKKIGIGTPGSKNPHTGLMRNCNTTCLNGMPFHADLQTRLGLELRIANDANCFALAEALWGAGQGFETVFGVIMGTGVGGGLVVGGKALEGGNGIAGEWGHNVLDPTGPDCYCGRKGCVETFLSGPANERAYAEASGQRKSLREIAQFAADGTDDHARAQIDRLCVNFGRAIATVINVVDPHCVVLGGGVGQIDALQSQGVDEALKRVFSDQFETPFLKPKLGDSAGVFGAALLVGT